MMGAERRSIAMTQQEKELATAYHEAGTRSCHVLVPAAIRCTR